MFRLRPHAEYGRDGSAIEAMAAVAKSVPSAKDSALSVFYRLVTGRARYRIKAEASAEALTVSP
jgi:hypothetical protein